MTVPLASPASRGTGTAPPPRRRRLVPDHTGVRAREHAAQDARLLALLRAARR